MKKPHLTQFGTPGIGVVPYGIHMCHFFSDRQELVDALIPFILAGIANHERCVWLAASPLPVDDITAEAAQQPALQDALMSGQLKLLDAPQWYGDLATFSAERAIQALLAEEQRALDDGFSGLRVTGNLSFVPPEHWGRLMEYERQLQGLLRNHRVVASCCYHRKSTPPIAIMEVVHRHDGVIDQADGDWQMALSPQAGIRATLPVR